MCVRARYRQGYYDTMDAGILMEDGNIAVMARSDDVINVAGHRLSTGALEEVDLLDMIATLPFCLCRPIYGGEKDALCHACPCEMTV